MYDPEAQHRQLALDLLRRHDGLERIGPLPRVRRSPSPRRVSTSSQSIDRNEDPMNESHIETFYNPTRRHSHLGGVSPAQFEAW